MKEIYIVHADAYIGCYKPGKCPMVGYAPREKFIDFVKGLREDYPDFKLRCVVNEGIKEVVLRKVRNDRAQILLVKGNRGR